MKACVALLRGINVGGRNSLPMKELSALLAEMGCRDIRTYIQSGNAVFHSDSSPKRLAQAMSAGINDRFGFEPHVLVLERRQFERAIEDNPFKDEGPESKALHLGFLDSKPTSPDLDALSDLKSPSEEFELVGSVFYLRAPDGVARSKLAARSERLLGCPMTDRNWRTVCKVMRLLEAIDG